MVSAYNVLAAVDLSTDAEAAVRSAVAFATAVSANLEIVYVQDLDSKEPQTPIWPLSAMPLPNYTINVRRRVLQGRNIAEAIAAHANTTNASMLWIAAGRYGRWNRFWRPSVADDLMRLTDRPLVVWSDIKDGGNFEFRKGRLLCVVGLDAGDTSLVEHAASLAKQTKSELVLLHVVPEASEGLLHEAVRGRTSPLSTLSAARRLADLARSVTAPTATSTMIGDPASCIALAAREHSVDLVMMSKAGRDVDTAYSGDLERIFARLRCPLITVPMHRTASGSFAKRAPAILQFVEVPQWVSVPAKEPETAGIREVASMTTAGRKGQERPSRRHALLR